MQRASRGQGLFASPLANSDVQNIVLASAEAFEQQKRLGEGGGPPPLPSPWDGVKVKNSTGGNLVAGNAVELGEFILTSFARQALWIDGIVPTAQGVPNIGVMLAALPENEIGPCQVCGVCLATVNLGSTADRFCYAQAGSHQLKGGPVGHFRILNTPTSSGAQTCVVALGGGVMSCYGKASALIDEQDDGPVNVWAGAYGSESATGQFLTAYNPGPPIYNTQRVIVGMMHGQLYVFPAECDP